MDQESNKELSQFMSGEKRLFAFNNKQDAISLEKVKKLMSFDV